MSLGNIFEQIKDVLTGNRDDTTDATMGNNAGQDILPASQDPLGDPADDAYGSGMTPTGYDNSEVLPASQDPLGDPADQMVGYDAGEDDLGQGILPADRDPLGDPADQGR